jgi:hypothetical protein
MMMAERVVSKQDTKAKLKRKKKDCMWRMYISISISKTAVSHIRNGKRWPEAASIGGTAPSTS